MTRDIRFPTSQDLSCSDAMNPDPDYSAAYAILKTDSPEGLEGLDLTFTIGWGNEICVAAIEAMARSWSARSWSPSRKIWAPSGVGSRAIAKSGGSGRRRASYTSPPPPSSTLSGTSTRRSRASPQMPGYSIEMPPESLEKYEFPTGTAWSSSVA